MFLRHCCLSLMKKDKYGWFSSTTHEWCCDSKSNKCIQRLNLSVAPPVTPAGRPPQTAVRALPCCAGWNHSYLTQENVFGCPWKRAVRDGGRQAEGGVDVGEGKQQWEEMEEGWWGFRDRRHLYSSLICDGVGKVGRRGSKAQRELWQDCGRGSRIKDAMLQDLTIAPRCLASAGRHRDTEINNSMSETEKGRAGNTHWRAWCLSDCFAKQIFFRLLVNQTPNKHLDLSLWQNVNHIFVLSYL